MLYSIMYLPTAEYLTKSFIYGYELKGNKNRDKILFRDKELAETFLSYLYKIVETNKRRSESLTLADSKRKELFEIIKEPSK